MPIVIRKDGDLFRADVTPPHCEQAWSTPVPVERPALIEELSALGCEATDVSEAFFEADNLASDS
jgi:hypothetical protein